MFWANWVAWEIMEAFVSMEACQGLMTVNQMTGSSMPFAKPKTSSSNQCFRRISGGVYHSVASPQLKKEPRITQIARIFLIFKICVIRGFKNYALDY
jgi:hypothetical protein